MADGAARQDGEVRMVDPTTGGEKGIKIDRFDLIPPEFEDALARHYGEGAKKYADRNWERGYQWHLSYRSVRSHLNAWLKGEDNDPETGTNHLICSIWHLIALYTFQIRGLGSDTIRQVTQKVFLGAPQIQVGQGGLGQTSFPSGPWNSPTSSSGSGGSR
jgi:hypothetical protein